MRKLLILCILAILPIACSRENAILRKASANLSADPEGTLYLLDSLDRNSLSERGKATYDYLTAYSFYRTYYFLDDASEAALQRACLYFEKNGPAVDRMRAWELMGTVQTATNRYDSGLVSFLKAEQVARSIEKARVRTWIRVQDPGQERLGVFHAAVVRGRYDGIRHVQARFLQGLAGAPDGPFQKASHPAGLHGRNEFPEIRVIGPQLYHGP